MELLFALLFATVLAENEADTSLPVFGEPIHNISTTRGKDATFYCRIYNIGSYKAEWVKIEERGEHISIGGLRPRVSLIYLDETTWPLRITDVQGDDSGLYMCKVSTNPVTMQMAYLHVATPPTFIDEGTSDDTEVEQGASVALVCRSSGYPKPSIKWRREGSEEITYFSNYFGVKTVRHYVGEKLRFNQVTREDAGIYYCFAVNGVPPTPSKRIMLKVLFSPEMKIPHYNIEASPGDDVKLICKVEANPKPENMWLASGNRITENKNYSLMEELTQINGTYYVTMSLTVRNFSKDAAENYTCASRNSLGYSESTIKVYDKSFRELDSGGTTTLEQLMEMESSCILDLKSKTYINPCCRKTKIGIPYHGKIIYLRKVKGKEMPPLPCSKIINSFRPEMKVQNYRIEGLLGDNVTVNCVVESYPKPVNTWLLQGNKEIPQNMKYDTKEEIRRINFSYVIAMKLIIKNFTFSDATNYTCSSRNLLGYSESTIQVQASTDSIDSRMEEEMFEEHPEDELGCLLDFNMNNYRYPCCRRNPYPDGSSVLVTKHAVQAEIGENVTILCYVLYTPYNLNLWTRLPGDDMLITNEKFNVSYEIEAETITYHKMIMRLVINNFTKADAGRYACSTRNELEYKQAIILVYDEIPHDDGPSSDKNATSPEKSKDAGQDTEHDALCKTKRHTNFFTPEFKTGKPSIETPCYKTEHRLGNDVTLKCLIRSFPRPVNTWIKIPGEEVIQSDGKHEVTEEHRGYFRITLRLTIKNISRTDEANYTCSSKNPFGVSEATIQLYGIPISKDDKEANKSVEIENEEVLENGSRNDSANITTNDHSEANSTLSVNTDSTDDELPENATSATTTPPEDEDTVEVEEKVKKRSEKRMMRIIYDVVSGTLINEEEDEDQIPAENELKNRESNDV